MGSFCSTHPTSKTDLSRLAYLASPNMKSKSLLLLLGFLVFSLHAQALELSLKLYPALSRVDGGDLNRNIQGWKSYLEDRNQSPYSLNYNLKELHGFWGFGAELAYVLSSRLSLALGIEFLTGQTEGKILSSLSKQENYFNSPEDFGTIFSDEQSSQQPKYRLQSIPLTLTIYYYFPIVTRLNFFLGCGAGYYWARTVYRENYKYNFDYRDEKNLSGSLVEFIDRYSSSGTYSEKTSSGAFGLQAKGGLEIKIRKRFHLILEAQIRRISFSGWKGKKSDKYTWSHTWGYWGAYSDSGSVEEVDEGKVWMAEFRSDETGKSYPRLVFSEQEPSSPLYSKAKLAKISLNGFSLRLGIRIYL